MIHASQKQEAGIFCPKCNTLISESAKKEKPYHCNACGSQVCQNVYYDDSRQFWVSADTNKLCQVEACIVMVNLKGEILFNERGLYPFTKDLPATKITYGRQPNKVILEHIGTIVDNHLPIPELLWIDDIPSSSIENTYERHYLYVLKLEENIYIERGESINPIWIQGVFEQHSFSASALHFIEKLKQAEHFCIF